MYSQSSTERHKLLLAASTMACQAAAENKGFRQRDVRRMVEFSASWAYPQFDEGGIPLENTQIRRYLEKLVHDGLAKKLTRSKQPRYSLTRLGFLELVSGVVNNRFYHNKEEFFYLYHVVRDYRVQLKRMIEREGTALSYALRLELEALFDSKAIVENQLYFAKRELKKLQQRMDDQLKVAAFARKALAEGMSYKELIEEVDERHPYCFNSSFRVSQFVVGLTQRQIIWELTVGCLKRKEHVWEPAHEALTLHIKQLKKLLAAEELSADDSTTSLVS